MRSSTAACARGGGGGAHFFEARVAYGLGVGVAASCVLLRTAKNFPPPSWVVAGAQHIRMLEPMHARIPQTAPIAPGQEAPKPISEKMELPQVCAVHEKKKHANAVHVHCMR